MRTCMYCGKELNEGEKCDCYMSRQRRGEKDTTGYSDKTEEEPKKEKKEEKTKYKTGYAGDHSPFERARHRYNAKKEARKNAGENDFLSDLWHYILCAVKDPVDAVTNPRDLPKGALLIIAALAGAALWLCAYFITRGGAVGPVKIVASFMGFGEGWRLSFKILGVILSGALGGLVMFFLYTGAFYLVNRFIIRSHTPYWQFCQRIVTAWIPFIIVCLIGSVIGMLSLITLIAVILCGLAALVALTYEGLKTEWITASPKKVLLCMLLGYLIIVTVAAHLILI